jgi:pimeloyl-ACP methyl ester carboxylesterase
VWVTPSDPAGPQRSFERVSTAVGNGATMLLKGLDVWQTPPPDGRSLDAEVRALQPLVEQRGRAHLFGFSAGATVALAAGLAWGEAVTSIAVFEPATIGDDDWADVEAEWRAAIHEVCSLQPPSARPAAFAALMQPPGQPVPPPRTDLAPWDERRDHLEAMLSRVGFVSADLAQLGQPCLVLTGRDSHPRFHSLADRLAALLAHARTITYPRGSHLDPPMREQPSRVAADLQSFWTEAERQSL